VDGDWIPDLAIGRLPVRTDAELVTALAESDAYEARDYSGTAVFAADGCDRFQATTSRRPRCSVRAL
jgi:Peptidase family C25